MRTGTTPILLDLYVHSWVDDPLFPFVPGAHVSPQDASIELILRPMNANGHLPDRADSSHPLLLGQSLSVQRAEALARVLSGVCRVNPEGPTAPSG